jgi:hypothetical protein
LKHLHPFATKLFRNEGKVDDVNGHPRLVDSTLCNNKRQCESWGSILAGINWNTGALCRPDGGRDWVAHSYWNWPRLYQRGTIDPD